MGFPYFQVVHNAQAENVNTICTACHFWGELRELSLSDIFSYGNISGAGQLSADGVLKDDGGDLSEIFHKGSNVSLGGWRFEGG